MKIVGKAGDPQYAVVYILQFEGDRLVGCVEAIQPPQLRDKK